MPYINMVEGNRRIEEDSDKLANKKSTILTVDKLMNSMRELEYLWDFARLQTENEKILYAVCHSDEKIKSWHERRRGNVDESYSSWKSALTERYFFKLAVPTTGIDDSKRLRV